MSFRSVARNLPPSRSVRGPGGCSNTSFSRRRESRGEGKGKSWQSFPHHGNHGSKPPPFAERKGARGMRQHVILAKAGIQRGRDGKIMAIIQKSWQSWFKTSPFAERKEARGMLQHVIPAKARIQRGREGKIMAIFPTSWQSWFKTSPLRTA